MASIDPEILKFIEFADYPGSSANIPYLEALAETYSSRNSCKSMASIKDFGQSFEEELLRHEKAMEVIESRFLEQFAVYPVGFKFTFEDEECTVLKRNMNIDWADAYIYLIPDEVVLYIVDQPQWRFRGLSESRVIWRQDVMKKRLGEVNQ